MTWEPAKVASSEKSSTHQGCHMRIRQAPVIPRNRQNTKSQPSSLFTKLCKNPSGPWQLILVLKVLIRQPCCSRRIQPTLSSATDNSGIPLSHRVIFRPIAFPRRPGAEQLEPNSARRTAHACYSRHAPSVASLLRIFNNRCPQGCQPQKIARNPFKSSSTYRGHILVY